MPCVCDTKLVNILFHDSVPFKAIRYHIFFFFSTLGDNMQERACECFGPTQKVSMQSSFSSQRLVHFLLQRQVQGGAAGTGPGLQADGAVLFG